MLRLQASLVAAAAAALRPATCGLATQMCHFKPGLEHNDEGKQGTHRPMQTGAQ